MRVVSKSPTHVTDACTSGPSMYEVNTLLRTRLTGLKRPRATADTYSWRAASRARAAEGLGRASPFKRHQRSRTHRRARACCRLLSSSFATMRMPYQCVRTCPGARGWGEAWAVGAVPSSCTEMAPHVVVVCSTCLAAMARGRRRLECVNHGGGGAAAPYPAGG